MLFAFHGIDRADASATRADLRPDHIAYQSPRGNPMGGPLLDDGGNPCGTLYLFDAADHAAAMAIASEDPYVTGGLFAHWSVHAFHAVDWPADP